jgi:hypothetical protein
MELEIDRDRYPLSPRVKMLKGILAKIRPQPPKASLAGRAGAESPNPSRRPKIMNRRGGLIRCNPQREERNVDLDTT